MKSAMTFCLTVHLWSPLGAEDWPRFRGPNGSGVSSSRNLPVKLDAAAAIWKAALPVGYSSPVVVGTRIYLTGIESDRLFTFALDFATGKIEWKREAPRPRKETYDNRNNGASASVFATADNLFVFFPDFGLLSYTRDGAERWRLPLGPFDNFYGMGASPILAGNVLVLVCDQTRGSFVLGVDAATGKELWRRPRTEAVSGHSTPILHDGLVIAPGSFRMDAYDPKTGESVWWVYGLASEMKSVPIADGDTVYINGYNLAENDPGRQIALPKFDDLMATADANQDGFLQKEEARDPVTRKYFIYIDFDHDGKLSREDWRIFVASMSAENGLLAVKSGGKGDVTATGFRWKYHRSIPQLPSTLLYDGVLYMINDGGILTTLNPSNGQVHKQVRLRSVSERIFASPVAADGKVYFVSQQCAVTVLKAGREHEILGVSELESECYATPAIVNGRILLRTRDALFAFGARN